MTTTMMMQRAAYLTGILLCAVAVLAPAAQAKVVCKDEAGQELDWYYLYKLPKHYSSAPSSNSSGLSYLWLSDQHSAAWQFGNEQIDSAKSMPGQTLQPIFDNTSVLLLAYNDEFPNGTTKSSGGHTKGVVATDGATGIWLVHSVPKYPDSTAPYTYPSSGTTYGQSFLCISLDQSQMQQVGMQLLNNQASVYQSRLPPALAGQYPTLEQAAGGNYKAQAPYMSLMPLQTIGRVNFQSFAKGKKFAQDLYEDWVAPQLKANLVVETWRNGGGNLPSNCSQREFVFDALGIAQPELQIAFTTTSDHSKWAVGRVVKTPATGVRGWLSSLWKKVTSADDQLKSDWICVGDINRQQGQLSRGGGTVCQQNAQVATLYRKLVSDYEKCINATTTESTGTTSKLLKLPKLW